MDINKLYYTMNLLDDEVWNQKSRATTANSMYFQSNRDDEEYGYWDSNDGKTWEAVSPSRTYCRCVSDSEEVECDQINNGDRGLDVADGLQFVSDE